MQEVQAQGGLRADYNSKAHAEGVQPSTDRVKLLREDGTLLASAILEPSNVGMVFDDNTWVAFNFVDVRLSHLAALSSLFGLTLPQLFDGCHFDGIGPHFLLHTEPVRFNTLPVRIASLQLIRPKKLNFVSWDDARIRYLAKGSCP